MGTGCSFTFSLVPRSDLLSFGLKNASSSLAEALLLPSLRVFTLGIFCLETDPLMLFSLSFWEKMPLLCWFFTYIGVFPPDGVYPAPNPS